MFKLDKIKTFVCRETEIIDKGLVSLDGLDSCQDHVKNIKPKNSSNV